LKYINGRPVCHKQGEAYAFFQNKRLDRSVKPFYLFLNAVLQHGPQGFILGAGAKMFTIAGPVIVYGVSASVIYGLIYWITTLF
jgi:hypothetical protein